MYSPLHKSYSDFNTQQPIFLNNICKEFQHYQLYKDHYEYMLNFPAIQEMVVKIDKLEKENKKLLKKIIDISSMNNDNICDLTVQTTANTESSSLNYENVFVEKTEYPLNIKKNNEKKNKKKIKKEQKHILPTQSCEKSFLSEQFTDNNIISLPLQTKTNLISPSLHSKKMDFISASSDEIHIFSQCIEDTLNVLPTSEPQTEPEKQEESSSEPDEQEEEPQPEPEQEEEEPQPEPEQEEEEPQPEPEQEEEPQPEPEQEEEPQMEPEQQEEEPQPEPEEVPSSEPEQQEEEPSSELEQEEPQMESEEVPSSEPEQPEEETEGEDYVYSVIINGKEYFTVNEINGEIFNEDVSIEVGKFVDGKPQFY